MASIGTTLREERIRLGLGIDQVEADTKIRAKYLMALEDERFEALPGTAYARAFLRDYAEQLGLDPQALVDRLNQVVGVEDDVVLAPRRNVAPRLILGRWQWIAIGGVAALLVAILAFAVYFVVSGSGTGTASGASLGGNAGTAIGTSSAVTGPTEPAVPAARVVFRAGPGNTWLEVRRGSAKGKVLFARVLAAGSHVRLTARKLWVDAGAPWNLAVKVNGRGRTVPANAKGHLLVTRSGVRAVA
ncbi:MAG TPA: RodZ domain-containing protein [Gaiellales bacterium]|nr:RodZ domain-containing protein [Gaiellales bacterium]